MTFEVTHNLSHGRLGKIEVGDTIFSILKQWESDPRYKVDRFSDFEIRVRYNPDSSGAPRYFMVKVTESL
jgi:hypothetical protein